MASRNAGVRNAFCRQLDLTTIYIQFRHSVPFRDCIYCKIGISIFILIPEMQVDGMSHLCIGYRG